MIKYGQNSQTHVNNIVNYHQPANQMIKPVYHNQPNVQMIPNIPPVPLYSFKNLDNTNS